MKLLSPNSTPRQLGLVLFGVAFVVMGGIALLIWGGLYVMLQHPPFSWAWILFAALAFGLLIYLTRPSQEAILEAQQLRRAREPIPGHHLVLGTYNHWPCYGTWAASPTLPNGNGIQLFGHGSALSESEVQTWSAIAHQIDSLVKKAESALLTSPDVPPAPFRLQPESVELATNGGFAIDFECASPTAACAGTYSARYSPAPALEVLGICWGF
jgi:hypothetical protein